MIPKAMFDYITSLYNEGQHPGWMEEITATNVDDFYVSLTYNWGWTLETVTGNNTGFYLVVNFETEQEAYDALEWIKTLDPVLFI